MLCLVPLTMSVSPEQVADIEIRSSALESEQIIRGAVVLPKSVSQKFRRFAAECVGCQWQLTSPCALDVLREVGRCEVLDDECRVGTPERLWWKFRDGRWSDHGLICTPVGGMYRVEDLYRPIGDALLAALPDFAVQCVPTVGAIVGIPVRCSISQSAEQMYVETSFKNLDVNATLWPTWIWRVDGVVIQQSGLRAAVTVPTRCQGTLRVDVRAHWRGRISIDGVSTTKPGSHPWVSQQRVRGVTVGRAVPQLVDGAGSRVGRGADVRRCGEP